MAQTQHTLNLFNSDGRALTSLVSSDDSILLPNAITVYDCEAVAHHAESGDISFDTLDELCAEYGLDVDQVSAALEEAQP